MITNILQVKTIFVFLELEVDKGLRTRRCSSKYYPKDKSKNESLKK